jgi:RNA polymerase sigma factor (sigma-70 family)
LNLSDRPFDERYSPARWKNPAVHIGKYLGIPLEDLFPPHLYAKGLQRVVVREVESLTFVGLEAAKEIAAPEIDMEQDIDLEDATRDVLHSLLPRQQKVSRSRFGIGVHEQTLEQVANELGVSRTRVQQIQAKALRILRHPLQSRRLRECLK